METMPSKFKKVIKPALLGLVVLFLSLLLPGKIGLADQDLLAFKNAKIFTMGNKDVIESGMVLVKEGKIAAIGKSLDLPAGCRVLDLAGKTLIPGIVCASSSLFLQDKDLLFTGDESPDSDILEGMKYSEDALSEIIKQGLTTVYISAASFQQVGGLGAVMKLRLKETGGFEILKEKAGLRLRMEAMEGNKTSSVLRLIQYHKIRGLFLQAQEYGKDWQSYRKKLGEYQAAQKDKQEKTGLREPERPAKDEGKEILLQVLDNKIPLRIEAHRPDAILNALRLGHEFGVKVTLEAAEDWPEVFSQLQEAPISLLTNPLMNYEKFLIPGGARGYAAGFLKAKDDDYFYSGKKKARAPEGKESADRWGPLVAAKIPLALIPPDFFPGSLQQMRSFASLLVAQGLSIGEALKTITSAPAEILGVSSRVGSLEEGKDADLVVLDGDPLNSLSKIEMVFIGGSKAWDGTNAKN